MKRWLCTLLMLILLTGSVCAAPKQVALTFDDGPAGKPTERLLDGLAQRGIPATFFLCCYRITEAPETVKRIAREGHELGVHGATHGYFTKMTDRQLRGEILSTAQAIRDLTGQRPTLLRPPGGLYDDRVLALCRESDFPVILWTVDPEDWDPAQRSKTVRRVTERVKDGDVILLHDLSEENTDAALAIADRLAAQGYTFCTVSQLAREKGISLAPGTVYRGFS